MDTLNKLLFRTTLQFICMSIQTHYTVFKLKTLNNRIKKGTMCHYTWFNENQLKLNQDIQWMSMNIHQIWMLCKELYIFNTDVSHKSSLQKNITSIQSAEYNGQPRLEPKWNTFTASPFYVLVSNNSWKSIFAEQNDVIEKLTFGI